MRTQAQRWRPSAALVLACSAALFGEQLGFLLLRARSSGLPLADGFRRVETRVRGPPPMRLGPGGGADPVNNVSPEMTASGKKWAQRYEDLFLSGAKLWTGIKKLGKTPKKLYFIGPNGNNANEVAESVCDALAYIPAPDGTYFIHRKPGTGYPKIKYTFWQTDKMLGTKSKIAPVDLYMDDPEKYRDYEEEIIKEFSELEYAGEPQACIVGEGAVLRESNIETMKEGIVIWLDADPVHTWRQTQSRPKQGGGLYKPPDYQQRPPVWAITNGWDGDIDDQEGKMEYIRISNEHRPFYNRTADIRIRTDIAGIEENSYWAAERIVKALSELLGIAKEAVSVEEEVLEKDLQKFLESARLSKYLEPAIKWCADQGAASIVDVVENTQELAEALGLKPLERKRLEKAATAVV